MAPTTETAVADSKWPARHLLAEDLFGNESVDMVKIARFGYRVIVASMWQCAPDLCFRLAQGEELRHIGWSERRMFSWEQLHQFHRGYIRHKLILQSTEEENWHLGDLR